MSFPPEQNPDKNPDIMTGFGSWPGVEMASGQGGTRKEVEMERNHEVAVRGLSQNND